MRKFCVLTLLQFHGNTSSITAKLCLVSTQNLLANHSCSIMRYCLKIRAIVQTARAAAGLIPGQIPLCGFCHPLEAAEAIVVFSHWRHLATVYKGNIIKNLIMDCQSYTKYRPNETTGGIFVSWRRKEELPTGA